MARTSVNFDAKREEILKIALSLFIEKGYEKTTVTMILQAAGISKGGMYHYFESKDAILDAVIHYCFDRLTPALEALMLDTSKNALDKLIVLMDEKMELPDELVLIFNYIDTSPHSLVAYRIREINIQRMLPYLVQVAEEGIKTGLFKMDYPAETAEFLLNAGNNVMLTSRFVRLSYEEQEAKVKAFSLLLSNALGVKDPIVFQRLSQSLKVHVRNAPEETVDE